MKNKRTVKTLEAFLRASEGQIFNVEFIKRTDGQLRKMNARIGVVKHLKGGTKKYDDTAKKLLTVFDMAKAAYRSIPLDSITYAKVNGVEYGKKS